MNLVTLLDEAASRNPAGAAIIECRRQGGLVTSFAGLQENSARLARLFRESGLREGDGIVVLVPMSAGLYTVIAAALRIGAVPVFIEPEQAEAQLARCRETLPLKAFAGTQKACLFRLLQPQLRTIRTVFVTQGWFPGATPIGSTSHLAPLAGALNGLDDYPAMLTFTSGSTGSPKGLLRSHRLLQSTQQILSRQLGLERGSINLATMPALVMANLGEGVTSLIPEGDLRHPGTLDPAGLAEGIQHWQAQSLLASPALVANLAGHCLKTGRQLDCLRAVFIGGAPVFPQLMDQAARIAPQARITGIYGSTEAEPVAMIERDAIGETERTAISRGAGLPAGRPIPEISLEILKDRWGEPLGNLSGEDFRQLVLPAGERGEVVISGQHVSSAYLGGLGDTQTKFRVAETVWHRTGDSGWRDEQGRLWLTGRCSARCGEGAQAVYPLMVEAALASHPELPRTALVCHRGKRLLVVESRHARDLEDAGRLATDLPWAGIGQIIALPRIPLDRRHNAKIDYPALARALEALPGKP